MATYNVHNVPALEAGADLSGNQYRFGIVNSSGQVVLNTVAGGFVDGVIQDAQSIIGAAIAFADWGVTKLVSGAAVAAGDLVASDTTGRGVTAVATNYARGRALTGSSAAGEIIEVLLLGPTQIA